MIDLPKYFDLSVEMKKLYISKDYYAPIKRNNNFSKDDYWLESVDPDGNKRNRIDEKEQYISDISAEMDYINKLKPGKILDIGCGLGWLLSAVDDGWEKHGVEISQYASEYATKYANIKNDDFLNVDYDSNFFDLIVMHHVIEHMENPIENLKQAIRMLKDGGTMIIATPNFDSGCARLFGNNYRLLHDSTHISLFSDDSMQRMLRDHSLLVDYVDYPYFNTRYFNKENLNKLFKTNEISPAFYGNFMTFYCRKNK